MNFLANSLPDEKLFPFIFFGDVNGDKFLKSCCGANRPSDGFHLFVSYKPNSLSIIRKLSSQRGLFFA